MVIQRSAITRNFPRMLAVAALFALMFGQLYAQVAGATLSGTVSDSSGSFISGAHTSIKNVATSQERVVTTDSAGFYSWPNLLVGNAGALDSTSTTSRETHFALKGSFNGLDLFEGLLAGETNLANWDK